MFQMYLLASLKNRLFNKNAACHKKKKNQTFSTMVQITNNKYFFLGSFKKRHILYILLNGCNNNIEESDDMSFRARCFSEILNF